MIFDIILNESQLSYSRVKENKIYILFRDGFFFDIAKVNEKYANYWRRYICFRSRYAAEFRTQNLCLRFCD